MNQAELDHLESASWRDYLELCKPAVVVVMIVTSLVGMFLAVPGMVPLEVLVLGNLGIALCAASAATVNHLVDRRIDLKMARTPYPAPRGTHSVRARQWASW